MSYQATLEYARQQDRDDALRQYRDAFHFPSLGREHSLYFSGHSLGLQPRAVQESIELELREWAKWGVEGHFDSMNPWYSYHELLSEPLARIVGAKPQEVVCMNSLTTNLHLLFVSFYRPDTARYKIISEAKMFPSDRYLLETQTRFHGFDPDEAIIEIGPRDGSHTIHHDDILAAIDEHSDQLALVFFGGVNYLTGQLFDIAALTRAAHDAGALAGFDLAHAAGNVPLAMHDWNADFAAWCSYKYLNSGPGNSGAVFVHERNASNVELPRFGGWWGHDKQTRFKMEAGFQPMPTAEGWQLSNAPVFGMAAIRASLALFDAAGIPALRKKSEKLTGYLEFLLDRIAAEHPNAGLRIITPRDPEQRGSQLSLILEGHDQSYFDRLTAKGVVADFREPCMIRIAPVPMYNSFEDVFEFSQVMRELLGSERG